MEIDSEQYYGILLRQEYHDAGEDFLAAMCEDLRVLGSEEDVEDVIAIGLSPYRLDVRCLIGFALTHTDYHFSVGGLCHVIGHQVRPFLSIVARHAYALQYETRTKISDMLHAVMVAPRE